MENSIEKACAIVGGQARMASICDVSEAAVSKWVRKQVAPPARCLEIETATKGEVTRYQLRPDIFGAAPAA